MLIQRLDSYITYKSKKYNTMATTKSPARPSGLTGKMENSEFHKFFVDELKDIYWAEKHLVKALPKMKKAATSESLAAAFEKHTQETETHIATLESVFALLDEKPAAKKCDAMAGLLEEGEGISEERLDAVLGVSEVQETVGDGLDGRRQWVVEPVPFQLQAGAGFVIDHGAGLRVEACEQRAQPCERHGKCSAGGFTAPTAISVSATSVAFSLSRVCCNNEATSE